MASVARPIHASGFRNDITCASEASDAPGVSCAYLVTAKQEAAQRLVQWMVGHDQRVVDAVPAHARAPALQERGERIAIGRTNGRTVGFARRARFAVTEFGIASKR